MPTAVYVMTHEPTGSAYVGAHWSAQARDWPREGRGFLPDGYSGSGSRWSAVHGGDPSGVMHLIVSVFDEADEALMEEARLISRLRGEFGDALTNTVGSSARRSWRHALTDRDREVLEAWSSFRERTPVSLATSAAFCATGAATLYELRRAIARHRWSTGGWPEWTTRNMRSVISSELGIGEGR